MFLHVKKRLSSKLICLFYFENKIQVLSSSLILSRFLLLCRPNPNASKSELLKPIIVCISCCACQRLSTFSWNLETTASRWSTITVVKNFGKHFSRDSEKIFPRINIYDTAALITSANRLDIYAPACSCVSLFCVCFLSAKWTTSLSPSIRRSIMRWHSNSSTKINLATHSVIVFRLSYFSFQDSEHYRISISHSSKCLKSLCEKVAFRNYTTHINNLSIHYSKMQDKWIICHAMIKILTRIKAAFVNKQLPKCLHNYNYVTIISWFRKRSLYTFSLSIIILLNFAVYILMHQSELCMQAPLLYKLFLYYVKL